MTQGARMPPSQAFIFEPLNGVVPPSGKVKVSGPSSLQVWFFDVPSEEVHAIMGRGGVRQVPSFGSIAPGGSERPLIGVFLQGGATVCTFGVLLMSGKLTPCIASR